MVELIQIGIVLLIASLVLIFVGVLTSKSENTKIGFVGFIGPFPFGFGNDPRLLWILTGIGFIIFILFLLKTRGII